MKKTNKVLIIAAVVVAVLGVSVVAFAAGNTSGLEQAWLDFQTKLNAELVDSGEITKDEADEALSKLSERFAESDEDLVLQRFSNAQERRGNGEGDGKMGNGGKGVVADYAELTGQDASDVVEALQDGETSIWQLAEQDGKFAELKALVLANIDERIADFEGDEARLEQLNAHRDEVAAMQSAADAPERSEGQGGKSGMGGQGGMGNGNGNQGGADYSAS